jgi:hypothetical protein
MVDIWDSLDDVDLRSISSSHGGHVRAVWHRCRNQRPVRWTIVVNVVSALGCCRDSISRQSSWKSRAENTVALARSCAKSNDLVGHIATHILPRSVPC